MLDRTTFSNYALIREEQELAQGLDNLCYELAVRNIDFNSYWEQHGLPTLIKMHERRASDKEVLNELNWFKPKVDPMAQRMAGPTEPTPPKPQQPPARSATPPPGTDSMAWKMGAAAQPGQQTPPNPMAGGTTVPGNKQFHSNNDQLRKHVEPYVAELKQMFARAMTNFNSQAEGWAAKWNDPKALGVTNWFVKRLMKVAEQTPLPNFVAGRGDHHDRYDQLRAKPPGEFYQPTT